MKKPVRLSAKPLYCWALLLLLAGSTLAKQYVVCIDPGHPSEVGRGTQGKRLTEIRAAWIEANLLKNRLEKKGVKVFLTKGAETTFVRNRQRAHKANEVKADLMVRLHCDASAGSGFASYYPALPGKSEGVRGPSAAVIQRSAAMAKAFHRALAAGLRGKLRDNGLKTDRATAVGKKQGALTGSVFSQVPVLLVEMVVLTNRKDEAFLLTKAGQSAMADALASATMAALKA